MNYCFFFLIFFSFVERYFVLIDGEQTLFYFASEPSGDVSNAVPKGGYPLEKAMVVQVLIEVCVLNLCF